MNIDINDQDFYSNMADVINTRYALNSSKSLRDVFQLNSDFLDTRSDTEFAIQNREKMLQVLSDTQKFEQLVDLFVHRAIEFTYASNQFIQIDSTEETRLKGIYMEYLRDIQILLEGTSSESSLAAGLNTLVKDHFLELRTNISRFFEPEARDTGQSSVVMQKVVCAEYSPETQIEVLGIDIGQLHEPVLDLGCGKSGLLVQYLRQNGVQANGIDRMVDPLPGLIQGDWLDYPLKPGAWGTVISHMAFSNHFLFHHLYKRGSIEPYARRYMEILRSLQHKGSFYYAPGLPFIETYLPADKYQVSRKEIVNHLYACRVSQINGVPGPAGSDTQAKRPN